MADWRGFTKLTGIRDTARRSAGGWGNTANSAKRSGDRGVNARRAGKHAARRAVASRAPIPTLPYLYVPTGYYRRGE